MSKHTVTDSHISTYSTPSHPLQQDVKDLYKTVWEIKQKAIIDQAADRGAFICQSQSLNIHMAEPTTARLTSMVSSCCDVEEVIGCVVSHLGMRPCLLAPHPDVNPNHNPNHNPNLNPNPTSLIITLILTLIIIITLTRH